MERVWDTGQGTLLSLHDGRPIHSFKSKSAPSKPGEPWTSSPDPRLKGRRDNAHKKKYFVTERKEGSHYTPQETLHREEITKKTIQKIN